MRFIIERRGDERAVPRYPVAIPMRGSCGGISRAARPADHGVLAARTFVEHDRQTRRLWPRVSAASATMLIPSIPRVVRDAVIAASVAACIFFPHALATTLIDGGNAAGRVIAHWALDVPSPTPRFSSRHRVSPVAAPSSYERARVASHCAPPVGVSVIGQRLPPTLLSPRCLQSAPHPDSRVHSGKLEKRPGELGRVRQQ
jgi:hypothetical protein